MKRLLFVTITCLSFLSTFAQFKTQTKLEYSPTWHDGEIIFNTGDTLQCKLRYNQWLSVGTLQVLENNNVITLPSKDVKDFSFFDGERSRWRRFSSMEMNEEDAVSGKVFVEHLYHDKQFSILNFRTVDVPYDYMNYTRLISKPVRISKKYILDSRTGELLPLSKENTLKLLQSKKQEIVSFIQQQHLRFKRITDYINVLEFHNSL